MKTCKYRIQKNLLDRVSQLHQPFSLPERLKADNTDVYFDDESVKVVISSLQLGDDQESGSLFINSNWCGFEEERAAHEQSNSAVASPLPSPNTEGTAGSIEGDNDKVTSNENAKDLVDFATSEATESKSGTDDTTIEKESVEPEPSTEPSIETSVVTSKPAEASQAATDSLPNGNLEANLVTDIGSDALSIKEVDPAPSKKKWRAAIFHHRQIRGGGRDWQQNYSWRKSARVIAESSQPHSINDMATPLTSYVPPNMKWKTLSTSLV
ncbi:serine/threonine-protein phosphatase 6 regulatory subunit 3-like protein [Tanacetum coccineum]